MKSIHRAIFVCAIGYFIDIFDIQLFSVLRVASLTELGVSKDQLATISGYILNAQMLGMVAGAFLWGWLGDRFGRLKALYGSILIYSIGTFGCSIVHDPVTYGLCRFIAGFGLAGETGAALTLVSELMSKEKRGWGATIVGGFGSLGPLAAVIVSWFLPWRETYIAAGVMGLIILALRLKLVEPDLFVRISKTDTSRGSLRMFLQPKRFLMLLCFIIIGLPNVYLNNLLNFYALELGHCALDPVYAFDQKISQLVFFFGIGLGNITNTALSQLWKSRRKAISLTWITGIIAVVLYLLVEPSIKVPAYVIYGSSFILGLSGTLVISITMASEHFGTNLRATSSVLASNLMRGGIIPMMFCLQWLNQITTINYAAAIVGLTLYAMAFLALQQLRETYGVSLDYVEKI